MCVRLPVPLTGGVVFDELSELLEDDSTGSGFTDDDVEVDDVVDVVDDVVDEIVGVETELDDDDDSESETSGAPIMIASLSLL